MKATRITWLLTGANTLFWVVFWVWFGGQSTHYVPHPPTFEERISVYVVFHRAVPQDTEWNLYHTLRIAQAPAFYATWPAGWLINKDPTLWYKSLGTCSPGGWLLIAVCLLSFPIWFAIGMILNSVIARSRKAWASPQGSEVVP